MKITRTLPLLALMAACTTITAQGPVPVTRTDDSALKALSWAAMQCVYTLAKVENDGKNISEADARNALPHCDVQISTYIDVLARRVQSDNGWSSLQPSVKPELRRQYEAQIIKVISSTQ